MMEKLMENLRLVKKLRSGRVHAEISLGESQSGTWYYNTRIFRPFCDPHTSEARKAYSFGQDDMAHVVDITTRAEAWINGQLANQQTVTLGTHEALGPLLTTTQNTAPRRF
jgi:hypothetical protein